MKKRSYIKFVPDDITNLRYYNFPCYEKSALWRPNLKSDLIRLKVFFEGKPPPHIISEYNALAY